MSHKFIKVRWLFVVLCFFCFSTLIFAQKTPLINALALQNGAHVIKATSSKQGSTLNKKFVTLGSPEALLDGNLKTGWRSAKGQPTACTFVFGLAETFFIKQIGFNNQQAAKNRSQSAKKVRIEFSSTSATEGYDIEYTIILEAGAPIRLMGIQNIPARWIRITVQSNYGNREYTQLNEIQAWGRYANGYSKMNVTGTWQTPKGLISLIQKGDEVMGCYDQNEGRILNGKVKGRRLTFDWGEGVNKKYGQAVFVINYEQNRLYGLWDQGKQFNKFGNWVFVKKSAKPSECPDLRSEGQAESKKK